MVEHRLPKPGVAGSIPVSRSILIGLPSVVFAEKPFHQGYGLSPM
jgi:hypothetical protein